MQKYENKTISKIIEEINTRYFLPDIQRPYVWKAEQIYALYDSILRGYPISTFLFWETSAEVIDKLTPRFEFLTANKKEYEDRINTSDEKENYSLVLDGQQRLTSLYLTLKGNFVIRNKLQNLYFNITSGKEEDEDGNLFEFQFFPKGEENIFVKDNKVWVNVKYINKFTKPFNIPQEVINLLPAEIAIDDFAKNNLMELWSKFNYEELINYYPERESDMDKVLDIFIRTNAGGTKLSKSDLLFSTIKRNWSEAREEFKTLLNSINKNDKYQFNHDFILKTCLVLFSSSQKDIKYSVGNISQDLIENIENKWVDITKAIKLVIDEIDNKYRLSSNKVLSSYNALIPLIYFVYINKMKTIDDANSLLMKKWLIKILLNGIFGGQADTMLYVSKKSIDESEKGVYPYSYINKKIIESKKSFNSVDEILDNSKLKYNSNDSFLILSLLYTNIDFNASYNGNLPQQDHIYSQSELRKNGADEKLINSIFNIQYLDAHLNKSKNDMKIDEWMKKYSPEDKLKHLIPNGEWNIDNYQEFLEQRKKLIKTKLDSFLS